MFQRKWYRNFLMKGFHVVVLLAAGSGIRDTQVTGFVLYKVLSYIQLNYMRLLNSLVLFKMRLYIISSNNYILRINNKSCQSCFIPIKHPNTKQIFVLYKHASYKILVL